VGGRRATGTALKILPVIDSLSGCPERLVAARF